MQVGLRWMKRMISRRGLHGLPVLPDWAQWLRAELDRRGLVEELAGVNCSPITVKGTKLRMLRILSRGLRRKVDLPVRPPAPLSVHYNAVSIGLHAPQ